MMQQQDEQPKHPSVAATVAIAILCTLGTELAYWVIDELKSKFGSKKQKHTK
jgi:flagellar motor component MotA